MPVEFVRRRVQYAVEFEYTDRVVQFEAPSQDDQPLLDLRHGLLCRRGKIADPLLFFDLGREIDPTFTGPDYELAERIRLACEQVLERHADDHVAGLRWTLRKYDLRVVARDARIDERTIWSFVSGRRKPHVRTLEKIERELVDGYGDSAEVPCFTARAFECCGLDSDDPLCRGLILIDEAIDEREREIIVELPDGRWRPQTKTAFKKARQRARAAQRSSSS